MTNTPVPVMFKHVEDRLRIHYILFFKTLAEIFHTYM